MPINKNHGRPYAIISYDPSWPQKFLDIKNIIDGVFRGKARSITHVGSTSIPGMSGKAVIDVLVTVDDVHGLRKEKEAMEQAGYIWEENYIAPDTVLCAREDAQGTRLENIHICLADSLKARQFIHVTEYLRNNPQRALAYGTLKEELFKKYPADYPAYRAAKQPFLEETRRLAYAAAGIDDPGDLPFIQYNN